MTQQQQGAAIASSVARELNDELTIILSAAQLVRQDLPHEDPLQLLLIDIQIAATKACMTTGAVNDFSARNGVLPSAMTVEELTSTL